MAITLVSSPTSPNGLYAPDAAQFAYVDQITINTVQSNAGDLQLDSGGIGAICSVGQYVYFAPLLVADNVDSPIAKIIAVDTNYIVIDVRYAAAITAGILRRLEVVEFEVATGYSANAAQPRRVSQTVKVKPDTDGIYRASGFLAGKSRLNFGPPVLSPDADYHHQVRLSVHPTGFASPANVVLMKATGVKAAQLDSINYTNFRGLISSIESSLFKIYQEDTKAALTLHEGASAVTVRRLTGQQVDFLFDTGLQTVANLSWSPSKPASIQYNGTGSNTDGFYITTAAFPTINGVYEISNTVTGDIWLVDIDLHQSLTTRASCLTDTIVVWWHPSGGWFTYAFPNSKLHGIEGNVATVTKDPDNARHAVAYEDIYATLTLYAEPEGETILDALNTLRYSPQIYIATLTGSGGEARLNLDTLRRAYTTGGGFKAKQTKPYQAMSNLFSVTLVLSDEIQAINE